MVMMVRIHDQVIKSTPIMYKNQCFLIFYIAKDLQLSYNIENALKLRKYIN